MDGEWEFPTFPFPNAIPPANHAQQVESRDPLSISGQINVQSSRPLVDSATEEDIDMDKSDSDSQDDPRIKKKTAPSTSKRSEEVRLFDSLLRKFLKTKGFAQPTLKNREASFPKGASAEEVKRYMTWTSDGPTPVDVKFYWDAQFDHPWNVKALKLLTSEMCSFFLKECLEDLATVFGVELLGKSQVNVEKLFKPYLAVEDRLKTRLNEFRRAESTRMKNIAGGSNSGEVEGLEANRIRSRRYERKKSLRIRRYNTIKYQLTVASGEERQMWTKIYELFACLEPGDASSDETEIEESFGIQKVVRRVDKPWLNPLISKIMHLVDKNYSRYAAGGGVKKGAAPTLREWHAVKKNTSSIPSPRLPRNMYSTAVDPKTLASLHPVKDLELPEVDEPTAYIHKPTNEMDVA